MVAARYINRELLSVFAVTALVLLVVAVGGRFVGYLQDAAAGKYAAEGLIDVLRLRLPGFLQLLLPFAFYIAVLLTFSRLHADREMAVLQCGGSSPARLLKWIAAPLAGMVALTAWLSLQVTPASNAALGALLTEQRARTAFEAVNPGLFNVFDRDSRVVYAESVSEDRGTLSDVFISDYRPGQPVATVWAREGRQYVDGSTGSRFLVLRDGRRYLGTSGARNYRVTAFDTLSQRIAEERRPPRRVDEDAVPTLALWARGDPAAVAELHWRVGLPVFCLISSLLALGIARAGPRQGRFARVVPAVLALLAYYFLLLVNRSALTDGALPLPVGLWPVHAVFYVAGAVLFARAGRPVSA
ncbi:MAG: LPS export ABC transporter permease LptF [Gammaproteobacteria bacterium]|nr:LPS export ABC transporter permease LptF [Gammaproteobacteria bacterium]MDE0368042.1 LPS export ABC transporter permease LptF [Gammaproteobacteria bacterium]